MKNANKVVAAVIFLCIAAINVLVANYLVSYYGKLGRKVPYWVKYPTSYIFVILLFFSGAKVVKLFSANKDDKKK